MAPFTGEVVPHTSERPNMPCRAFNIRRERRGTVATVSLPSKDACPCQAKAVFILFSVLSLTKGGWPFAKGAKNGIIRERVEFAAVWGHISAAGL